MSSIKHQEVGNQADFLCCMSFLNYKLREFSPILKWIIAITYSILKTLDEKAIHRVKERSVFFLFSMYVCMHVCMSACMYIWMHFCGLRT